MKDNSYKIKEISEITGVKAGTIRFYERLGFIEQAERLPNNYRIFNLHHIYQIQICRLVFGGFVNKNLRKVSLEILKASSRWDLEAYDKATRRYKKAIEDDIERTEKAISLVMKNMGENITDFNKTYSKKQAAKMLGVTPETIRNWERNGLLMQGKLYQKRFYGQYEINRMYVIRLLLDTGYSIMAILSFFQEYDEGKENKAKKLLLGTEASEELIYRADKYLNTLFHVKEKANTLCGLLEEMEKM